MFDPSNLEAYITSKKSLEGSEASIQLVRASEDNEKTEAMQIDANKVLLNSETGAEGYIEEASQRIRVLEEDVKIKEELIHKLEMQLETKGDLLNIANAKVATIKVEMIDKPAKYRSMKIFSLKCWKILKS